MCSYFCGTPRVRTSHNLQAFLRKQKFQYLEQNAKDKYIRAIVSDIDDAPVITSAINEALRADNEFKKERLRAKKAALADKHRDIRTLAPLVLQGTLPPPSSINPPPVC